MDVLQRIEEAIRSLQESLRRAQLAEKQALVRSFDLEEKCSALQQENQALRQSLERERLFRQKAIARMDAIIGKIHGYKNLG